MPITVDLYPDAPYLDAQVVKGKKNIWRLDVINGSHTAVTFNDAGKIKLRPQAGNGVIPFEPELWIDRDPANKKRTIYFYCRRDPDAEKDSVCLIETPDIKGDAPLQVWSRHHHNRYVFIKLYGRSLALNSTAPGIWPYPFKNKEAVSDDATAESVIDLVARRGNLDHLVINAHGTIVDDASMPGGRLATCWVGKGLSTNNLHLWDRLKGKVKYIWLMNCDVGNDNFTWGTVAQKVGAWVSGPVRQTLARHPSMPPDHIEFFDWPRMKHWNGPAYRKGEKDFVPLKADDFFRSARDRASPSKPSLDEAGLYFNIVQLGPKYQRGR